MCVKEEHSLLQLEEALEALDAAVEFKDRSIQERHTQLGGPAHNSPADPAHHDVIRKLRELSQPEASALLVKYFNKVRTHTHTCYCTLSLSHTHTSSLALSLSTHIYI